MVTPLVPSPAGLSAGAIVMHGQLSSLARRHRVTLAAVGWPDPSNNADVERLRETGCEVCCVWRPRRTAAVRWRLRLARTVEWLGTDRPMRAIALYEPELQRSIDRLTRERKYDVVQVEDIAAAGYRYPRTAPIVLTDHDVRPRADAVRRGAPGPGAFLARDRNRWRRYQARCWRRFDAIQVFTARDAAEARTIEPEIAGRTFVNPFGVDLPAAADTAREEPATVVFVGGFLHPPNVDAALWLVRDILPEIRRRRPDVRLVLAGADPPRPIRALARDGVEVTGRVPAVEPVLERAAVVVAPLRTGGGMRLKVLQAMGMGKAVVATSLAAEGVTRHDGDDAMLVADDARAFAACVAELLGAPDSRRSLGRRAREAVRLHHGWAGYGERLEALYAAVRDDRRRTSVSARTGETLRRSVAG